MRSLRPLSKMYVVKHEGHIYAYRTRKEFRRDIVFYGQQSIFEAIKKTPRRRSPKQCPETNMRKPVAMW